VGPGGSLKIEIDSDYLPGAVANATVSDKDTFDWTFTPSAITPTALAFDTTQGGVDYSYQVSGALVQQTTQVALYWSPTQTYDSGTATLIPGTSQPISAGTQTGSYGPFNVSTAVLGQPPAGTNYLLAVTDPKNVLGNFDQSSNVQSLALPDIVATSLQWHTTQVGVSSSFTPDQGGGVDLSYKIDDAALPAPATIVLYWVHGTDFVRNDLGAYTLAYETASATTEGPQDLHVPADDLALPPQPTTPGANDDLHLLLVVNAPIPGSPDGTVVESDLDNDVAASATLAADPVSILSDSVQALPLGAVMTAAFRPAGGALTLQQAAAILGLDPEHGGHFNWIQTITAVPSDWTVYRQSGPNSNPVQFFPMSSRSSPLYDPDTGYPLQVFVQTPTNAVATPIGTDGIPDHNIYYFNDPDPVGTDNMGLAKATSDFQLYFSDEASLGSVPLALPAF
jgi:hypothetical protein